MLDLADIHQLNPSRYPFLLESVSHAGQHARFSILFAFPGRRIQSVPCPDITTVVDQPASFLASLDAWFADEGCAYADDGDLPFTGGWFLALGYELGAEIEPTLDMPVSPHVVAEAIRVPCAIIADHRSQTITVLAEADHQSCLEYMLDDCLRVIAQPASAVDVSNLVAEIVEETPDRYLMAVERIRRYIIDGDVFQVNLSREWKGELMPGVDALQVYRQLRMQNPAPFAGLAHLASGCIISSSPERLVRVRDGIADTRPIAGTRPRGSVDQQDSDFSSELLAHPKERAEHVMLIDLERNDLGRVCVPGSVEVDELMVLESFAHVHHIVSNVRGRLRNEITPGRVMAAVFPGGTITGCPKVRCMEIIAELEQQPRGIYTGSMGYLNRNGSMDLNILIRSIWLEGSHFTFRTGAGIVADSIAQGELEETRAKAKGLLLGLGMPLQ